MWLDERNFAMINTKHEHMAWGTHYFYSSNSMIAMAWELTFPPEVPISLTKTGKDDLVIIENEAGFESHFRIQSSDFKSTYLNSPLEATSQPYFSAATERYAYGSEDSTLIIRSLDGEMVRELPLPGNPKWEYYLADAAWSADGERLALQVIERSNYTGKQFNVTNYILTPANWGIQELATIETYNSTIRWSPDEESLILSGTVPAGDGYALSLSRLNPSNRKLTTYDAALNITAPDYLTFSRIGWLVTGE